MTESDRDNVLVDILVELREMNQKLAGLSVSGVSGEEERLPSVAIEDMATGEKVKVTTKSYAGHPLSGDMIDAHLDAHAYAHQRAAELAMSQWQQQLTATHKRIYGEEPNNTAYDLK